MELSELVAYNVTAGNWLGARPAYKLHCYAQVVRLSLVLLTLEALERERETHHTHMHTQRQAEKRKRTTSAVGKKARGSHWIRERKRLRSSESDKQIMENTFNSSNPWHTRTNMNTFVLEFRLTFSSGVKLEVTSCVCIFWSTVQNESLMVHYWWPCRSGTSKII